MILGVFSFILETALYKAKCTSIDGISTRHSLTVEHLYRQHWAQQTPAFQNNEPAGSLKLPVLQQLTPTAEQEGEAGPHEGMVRELGAVQGFPD